MGRMGHQKRRVKPVTHIRLASVGEENICGGVVRGIGSTDIRIRSRGVLYSSTSTVVSTRSLLPVNMSRVSHRLRPRLFFSFLRIMEPGSWFGGRGLWLQ